MRQCAGGDLDQMPVLHAHHAIHAGGEIEVVGGDQRGDPLPPDQLDQLVEYELRSIGIEIAGRLVGEDQLRRVGERTADGGALLLAA